MAASTQRPVFEALRRRGIEGALWRHATEDGRHTYSVSVSRSHKNANGEWTSDVVYALVDDISRIRGVLNELENKAYELMQSDYEASKRAAD